ncbi:MAG: hypothetical protein JWM32_1121 [Verrucomicrobia bacterium]|nr:hypothetical protein [Verrucomicrobiota bacterium]
MSHIFLALYLIIVGLTILFGLNLPAWIAGILALVAGVLMLVERFGFRVSKKVD